MRFEGCTTRLNNRSVGHCLGDTELGFKCNVPIFNTLSGNTGGPKGRDGAEA